MPVNVCVALLAPETRNVDPLGRHDARHCLRDAAHDTLQGEVFVGCEVVDHRFTVFDRRDQDLAELDMKPWKERDVLLIAVHDVFALSFGGDTTHEAAARLHPCPVGGRVERTATDGHGTIVAVRHRRVTHQPRASPPSSR